jgi:hypothetical protein
MELDNHVRESVPQGCRISGWVPCVAVIMFLSLAYENLDGYHNEWFRRDNNNRFSWISRNREMPWLNEPPYINWTHGWPLSAMIRNSPWQASDPGPRPKEARDGLNVYSRWPFDHAPVYQFSTDLFVVNAFVACIVLAGTIWVTHRWTRHSRFKPQFSLKAIFGLMTLVAILLVYAPRERTIAVQRSLHFMAQAMIVLCVMAAAVVLAQLAIAGLKRLAVR